ncbi:MAG TPA: GntG family PLP-dependent aldolase [Candidatus Limnocylindrales bacterium]
MSIVRQPAGGSVGRHQPDAGETQGPASERLIHPIDLRSDTVTVPSPEMRDAIARAEVGDDFYGEDATVRAFEARAAKILGKEAALYVPSGTMANLLAHLTHAPGGGEVIGPEPAHSFLNEGGGPSRVAGMTVRGVHQERGELDLDRYAALIHGPGRLAAATKLLWVEQPTRGYVVPLADLDGLRRLADTNALQVHFDGARIFNAAIALGVTAQEIADYADTVMFCVSKGLAAPVGSVLAGPGPFIAAAAINRQMLGGAMRQAGIIAAAGLFALEHNVDRLEQDHVNAGRLADGLRRLPGVRVDRVAVDTNMFYAELARDDITAQEFATRLIDRGVLVNRPSAQRRTIRFVTHYGIDTSDIDTAVRIAAEVLESPTVLAPERA